MLVGLTKICFTSSAARGINSCSVAARFYSSGGGGTAQQSYKHRLSEHKQYDDLMKQTSSYRDNITNHALFAAIKDMGSLRIFMENHVFAVYDFMTLLKNLQKRFTNTRNLWTPPHNKIASRLMNEIVLGEESDEPTHDVYTSHYELYLQAMKELGASTSPVLAMTNELEKSQDPEKAFAKSKDANAAAHAIQFVRDTLDYSNNPARNDIEVAAYFLFGREDPIPDMFRTLLKQVPELKQIDQKKSNFVLYLERHIHLDEEEHGPMARRLLESLCEDDQSKWDTCRDTSIVALKSRAKLWDGVLKQLK